MEVYRNNTIVIDVAFINWMPMCVKAVYIVIAKVYAVTTVFPPAAVPSHRPF